MHVLVFEPARGGHHLTFLRHTVEDFLSANHTVTLAVSADAQPAADLQAALGPLLARCRWHPLEHGPGRFLRGRRLDQLARAQAAIGADLVFVNCLDVFTSSLFRRRAFGLPAPRVLRGRVAGIFVRPRVMDTRVRSGTGDRLKRLGFHRLVRDGWFRRILTLDETLPEALPGKLDPRLVAALPDPWEGEFTADRDSARRLLGLPPGKFLFLHYGTASPRKGLPTVLRACAQLPAELDAALVCAGRAGETHAAELATLARAGRAHVFNRHIDDSEEPLLFRACDAVVLAYEGHYGSSAIQARAAAAGRMVISSDEGLVGHRTRSHGLGLTFATRDASALAKTLAQAARLPADAFATGLSAYARHHSRANFRQVLLASLAG